MSQTWNKTNIVNLTEQSVNYLGKTNVTCRDSTISYFGQIVIQNIVPQNKRQKKIEFHI